MDNIKRNLKWPFFIQLPTLCFIGIILFRYTGPFMPGPFLETASNLGFIVCFFACIPVGIIGVGFSRKRIKRMEKLRIPARVLGIINIVLGAGEIFIAALIFADIIPSMIY